MTKSYKPTRFPGRILHPSKGPLTMSGSKKFGAWEDAGKWISGAGHSINQLVGGGDHKVGAKRIKKAGKAIGNYLGRQVKDARKHFLGFGAKPASHLPKGPKFPKRVTNKTKTGLVNKHKYKKGTVMV